MQPAAAAVSMDRMYRRQRHIYDLTRKYYLLGRDRLITRLRPEPNQRVLEVGCGTGRNLVQAARLYPQARFFGIDISAEMLTTASEAVSRAGLTSRITVARADATGFDPSAIWGEPKFDRIFISYSLSMIPEWRQAIACAVSLLSENGQLHIVDFGAQEGLPNWFRTGLRHWLNLFGVIPRDELESELRTYTAGHLVFVRPYRGYAQRAVLTVLPR